MVSTHYADVCCCCCDGDGGGGVNSVAMSPWQADPALISFVSPKLDVDLAGCLLYVCSLIIKQISYKDEFIPRHLDRHSPTLLGIRERRRNGGSAVAGGGGGSAGPLREVW